MAGSYITFNDGSAAQLDNGMTAIAAGVGSRFKGWTSEPRPIGPAAYSLGTGARAMFAFRTDYVATFSIVDIPNTSVDILDRLIAHLRGGGVCTVVTGDASSRTYTNCALAEGADVAKTQFDARDLTWQVTLTLVNLDAAPLLCVY